MPLSTKLKDKSHATCRHKVTKSKISGNETDAGCTSVIGKNMTHCVPTSQKSAGVKKAYFHLNLNLLENMKRVPKICFAFLSFKDH